MILSNKKNEKYEFQVRNIGGSDVFYKRKIGDKLWGFSNKEEFELNKNIMNKKYSEFAINKGTEIDNLQIQKRADEKWLNINKELSLGKMFKAENGGVVKKENLARIYCHNTKCNWNWSVESGGDDLYVCHKCNTDNEKFYENGGLIAPNGKPSNLTPEQYKLVRSSNFKKWFGDWEKDTKNSSKVVDENGEPKVMYHSSDSEFTIFNPEQKSRWTNQRKEKAIWFGGNNKVSSYTNNGYLYEVFLCSFNPIIVDAKDYDSWNYYYDENNNKTYDIGRIKGRFITQAKEVKWDGTANNNDGILFLNAWDNVPLGVVCVVFESNQIKLADGTNTTFDGNNPDIRFDDGGELKYLKYKNEGAYADVSKVSKDEWYLLMIEAEIEGQGYAKK